MLYLICHMRKDADGGATYVPVIVYETMAAVQWWLEGQADLSPTVVKWDSEFRASIYAGELTRPMDTFAILPFQPGEHIVL